MRTRKTPRRKVTPARKRPREKKSSAGRLYPFCAIVGQEEMKLALVLNAIDPLIGGVLIMGHRGTGKSTAVRGLVELLPEMWAVRDCIYRCDPVDTEHLCAECRLKMNSGQNIQRERVAVKLVELPLGATEDRVCGTIDIERALQVGTKVFEPGLLARANRGFLYIDEVNLLEDHLVDLLLDAAATGHNRVERESVSVEHPARFVLIGSGNPEEGELRPQLQDRFGLHVEVTTDNTLNSRIAVVEKREAFELDPDGFLSKVKSQQDDLRRQIGRARNKIMQIKNDRTLLRQIAQLCTELKIDGHRGELTIARAARALAAFEACNGVTDKHVKRVAIMSLRHRLRRDVLEELASSTQIEEALRRVFSNPPGDGTGHNGEQWPGGRSTGKNQTTTSDNVGFRIAKPRTGMSVSPQGQKGAEGTSRLSGLAEPGSRIPPLATTGSRFLRPRSGRPDARSARRNSEKSVQTNREGGRYSQSTSVRTARLAIDATLRATASTRAVTYRASDRFRKRFVDPPFTIRAESLRYKLFSRKNGNLFIFAIDTSGSMALSRINQAKGALLQLLKTSYLNRDKVAIISFGGTTAKLLLLPSRSMLRARRVLDSLSVGGGTPLPAGLACALEIARRARSQHSAQTTLLLFTDGRANVSFGKNIGPVGAERSLLIQDEIRLLGDELRHAGVTTVVVETQRNGFASRAEAGQLAHTLSAKHVQVTSDPTVKLTRQ